MSVEALVSREETVWAEQLPSLAVPVNELIDDHTVLAQTMRFAGSVLLEQEVDSLETQPLNSLMDALRQAANGSEAATSLVRSNVATDLMERTIKAGFVSESRMEIDEYGHLRQHNQSYQSVQANSLRYMTHPVMRARTWAETKNCFRLEELVARDILNEYSFVVFSLAEPDLPEYFFADTQTLTIQVSRQEGDTLLTQTAFVAGKSEDGKVHDTATVGQIIDYLSESQDAQTTTPRLEKDSRKTSNAELIDQPWLIHNSLLPNGVIDLVAKYDELNNGTFYGQNQAPQDYSAHQAQCLARTQDYVGSCEAISTQLISEADQLDTPLKATLRLDQLSRSYSLRMAAYNPQLDAQVFGPVAAHHIDQARLAVANGDMQELAQALSSAVRHDTSTSCPGGPQVSPFGFNTTIEGLTKDATKTDQQEDKYGALSFYCSKGHLNTRPKNHLIERCQVCKISVKCS